MPSSDLGRFRPYWSFVDPAGSVPVDPNAEATVAGCAIAAAGEAAAARDRLRPDQLYSPILWQIIEAAADLPVEVVDDGARWSAAVDALDAGDVLSGCAARIEAIAAAIDVPASLLRGLVHGRLTEADTTGWFAQRVAAAATARARIRVLLDDIEGLGVDVDRLHHVDPVPAVLALAQRCAEALGVEVARGDGSGADVALDRLIEVAETCGVPTADARHVVSAAFARGGKGEP